MGKVFIVSSMLVIDQWIHTEGKFTLGSSPANGAITHTLLCKWGSILQKSHINAMKVGKHLGVSQILQYIREFILGRNPIDVMNVGKPLEVTQAILCRLEYILERNPMSEMNIANHLVIQ